jgi:hypothetical protein
MRQDSLAAIEKARADSAAAIERARMDSIARADSIAREAQFQREQRRGGMLFGGSGFYIGLAGGATSPMGDLEDLGYGTGFEVNVPIGWHKPGNALGLRLDLGYSKFDGAEFVNGPVILANSDPKIWSATLNATLKFPLNENRTTNLYAVGGGGLYAFRNFGATSALGGFLGNDVLDPQDEAGNETTINKWGANGGLGLEFGVGGASLFLESRFVNVFANRDDDFDFNEFFGDRSNHVRWVPIVLGVNFR